MEETKETVKKPKRDTQSRDFCLCLHNIKETGFDHGKIKDILHGIPSLQYFCIADEIGLETKKLHTHVYIRTRNPIRFSTLKNKFSGADLRIEQCRGNPTQNRDYVFKIGKWENDEKADQRLPDTQEEEGSFPVIKQGQRTELTRIYEMVKDGFTNSEIIEACGDTAIKYADKLDKLRHIQLTDKFRGTRRLGLKVHYITGKTGTGKTRGILDEYGDENVYRVTDYQHPFDSYQCQPVILFDEFRSNLRLSDMLNYLDIYPVALPARYAPRVACYSVVYVVSNWSFEQQYPEMQKDPEQESSYEAWVRRFNGCVKEYTDEGITTYPTMQDYLSRFERFHTPKEPVPFEPPKQDQKAPENPDEKTKFLEPDSEPLPWEAP